MNLLPFRKRVQKYNFFSNWPNNSTNFFWIISLNTDNQENKTIFQWDNLAIRVRVYGKLVYKAMV